MLMSMTRAQSYASTYRMHRAALQDLYAALPDDQGHFKAWDGGMSFIGLADHLSASASRVPALLRGEKPAPMGEGSADLGEARARLAASGEQVIQTVQGLSDEDISRRITAFGGREMTVSALIDQIISHEAHHKGQAWMMARMVGVTPPFFVKLG